MIEESLGNSCHHFLEHLNIWSLHFPITQLPFLPDLAIHPWVWIRRNFGEANVPREYIITYNLMANDALEFQSSIPIQ